MKNRTPLKHAIPLVSLIAAILALNSPLPLEALKFRGSAPKVNNLQFSPDLEVSVEKSLSVNHRGPAADYFITFSPGGSGNSSIRWLSETGGSAMYYNLFDSITNRTILRAISDNPAPSQVITGSFSDAEGSGGGTTRDHQFVLILDRNQFPVAGTYSDVITLNLYEGTPASPVPGGPLDSMTMNISTVMPQLTDLALLPEAAAFDPASSAMTMNFGTLFAGMERNVDIVVRSNTIYSVSVSSLQGGNMAIADPLDTSVVPYQFSVSGFELDLSGSAEVPIVSLAGPTDEAGDRYPISVTILDYGMATEGLYSDTITFTLSAP
jgi:spore coat protein U-like protein